MYLCTLHPLAVLAAAFMISCILPPPAAAIPCSHGKCHLHQHAVMRARALIASIPKNMLVSPSDEHPFSTGPDLNATVHADTQATVDKPLRRRSSASKLGICYNDPSKANTFSSDASWAYNWDSTPGPLQPNVEFVPMLWGNSPYHTQRWESNARNAIAKGSKYLLAFNEPDHAQQSTMTPELAARDYKRYMSDTFGGISVRLGAPAVTNGGGAMGLNYLSRFLAACGGCQIDFVPIHWYDTAQSVSYFKNHVMNAHRISQKPIWITEFGATGSDQEIVAFLKDVIPWLDSQPYVQRYAYFMARDGLLNTGAAKSAVGQAYVNYAI